MMIRKFLPVLTMFFLLLPVSVFSAGETVDLSGAVIVVPRENQETLNAARFLSDEIFNRTGIQPPIRYSMPVEDIPVVILGQHTTFPFPEGITVPVHEESFALWADENSRSAPTILVIGRDDRGVLFGTGKLLRLLCLSHKYISISANITLASAPADKIRAQQIISNTQCEDAYTDWDDSTQVQQFVRDMVIFGTNGFEPTQPALTDHYLESLGIDLYIKLRCQDIIDYDQKSDEELLNLYHNITGIDHITTYGGDASGAVKPQLFFPHAERVIPLILRGNPGVKWWYSNQCIEDHARDYDDYIFTYIREKKPSWLYGMVYGPWTKRGIPEIREDLPARYAIRHFPENCHPRWCQYPVPGWDRIFAVVWPRNNSIYVMPSMMLDIYKATREHTVGSLPYNHTGGYNDLNKFIWSAAGWDPETDVKTILSDYARVFFAYDFTKYPDPEGKKTSFTREELIEAATRAVVKGLLLLEQNWTGPLKDNTSTEEALNQWKLIADCMGGPQKNRRVEMYYWKALIDARIKRKYDVEMKLEQEAYRILKNADRTGIRKAKKAALAELAKIDNQFPTKEEFLKKAFDSGLTDRFGDIDEIANNLYTSFNDRYWIEDQLKEAKNPEDIFNIINYEDPGEGGYYDNLGVPGEQPHLVRQLSWNEDPGFVHSPIEWVDNKTNPDERHSRLTHALCRYDTPLLMRWEGLDGKASYRLRVVYNGPFDVSIRCQADEGSLIHDFNKKTGDRILEFKIPEDETDDGVLELKWTQEKRKNITRGVSVSETWLIKENTNP